MKRHALAALLLLPVLALSLSAQAITFRYFYDDANELFRVLDSTGTLIEYIYDPAGNITQINRSTVAPGSPAILNITTLSGIPGDSITIYGQNFSTVPANDVVKFNGVTATVLSATATQLVVQVPSGVTMGQVTVTVGGVTVSSGPTLVFTPLPAPVITSLAPDGGLAGTVVPNVAVTGANLMGAIFNFPAGATASASNVTSTSATLQVTTMAGIRGAFPLIATTSAGSSTSSLTAGNQFIVMLSPDEADTQVFSVLNKADPISQGADPTNVANSTDSKVASVLNTVDPISQGSDPTNVANSTDSKVASVLNTVDPIGQGSDPTNVSDEADSALVSLLNSSGDSMSRTSAASARARVGEFAAGFTGAGSVQVAQSGASAGLVAGQRLAVGIRAQREAQEVGLSVNGAVLATSRQRPWVFTFNVPVGASTLAFLAVARDANGAQLASFGWKQAVLPDAATTVTGRVVDAAGKPLPGARVAIEAAGLYGEFFDLRAAPTRMPELAEASRTRAGLVSGLDWLNPQGLFGDDPMGLAGTRAWAARFSGQFVAPASGTYAFPVSAQAGATVVIDGRAVSGSVDLAAGPHAMEVSYYKASEPAALEVLWVAPDGAVTPLPLEGVTASDPALADVTGADGAFSIAGVPASVDGLRVVVRLPDGRAGASGWQAPSNGVVTGLGDIVVGQAQH